MCVAVMCVAVMRVPVMCVAVRACDVQARRLVAGDRGQTSGARMRTRWPSAGQGYTTSVNTRLRISDGIGW